MDKSFQSAVKYWKPVVKNLTHRQVVMRLYRKALKQCDSWAESRTVFIEEAGKIREQFDANKGASQADAIRLVREAEEKMHTLTHPDPYIRNYMPGGTLFMRNPAVAAKFIYPDGIPTDGSVDKRRYNIDFSRIPEGDKYAKKAFVDSANKTYWIDE